MKIMKHRCGSLLRFFTRARKLKDVTPSSDRKVFASYSGFSFQVSSLLLPSARLVAQGFPVLISPLLAVLISPPTGQKGYDRMPIKILPIAF